MLRNTIFGLLIYVIAGTSMGLMIGFVTVNILVGCENWSDSACVKPKEFIGFFLP